MLILPQSSLLSKPLSSLLSKRMSSGRSGTCEGGEPAGNPSRTDEDMRSILNSVSLSHLANAFAREKVSLMYYK